MFMKHDDFNEISKVKSSKVSMTVVWTENSGQRLKFSKEFMRRLNNPEFVQIAVSEDSILIGEEAPNCDEIFILSSKTEKNKIYSKGLVRGIKDHFNLDFSSVTSLTFIDIKFDTYRNKDGDDNPIAIVKLR